MLELPSRYAVWSSHCCMETQRASGRPRFRFPASQYPLACLLAHPPAEPPFLPPPLLSLSLSLPRLLHDNHKFETCRQSLTARSTHSHWTERRVRSRDHDGQHCSSGLRAFVGQATVARNSSSASYHCCCPCQQHGHSTSNIERQKQSAQAPRRSSYLYFIFDIIIEAAALKVSSFPRIAC